GVRPARRGGPAAGGRSGLPRRPARSGAGRPPLGHTRARRPGWGTAGWGPSWDDSGRRGTSSSAWEEPRLPRTAAGGAVRGGRLGSELAGLPQGEEGLAVFTALRAVGPPFGVGAVAGGQVPGQVVDGHAPPARVVAGQSVARAGVRQVVRPTV